MAAATSARPVRIRRGRSWRCAGARAITWPTSSRKGTSEMRNAECGMRIGEGGTADDSLAREAEDERGGGDQGLTRRDMLKVTAVAAASVPLIGVGGAKASAATQGKAPLFFTPDEFAMIDELTEIIIPT